MGQACPYLKLRSLAMTFSCWIGKHGLWILPTLAESILLDPSGSDEPDVIGVKADVRKLASSQIPKYKELLEVMTNGKGSLSNRMAAREERSR